MTGAKVEGLKRQGREDTAWCRWKPCARQCLEENNASWASQFPQLLSFFFPLFFFFIHTWIKDWVCLVFAPKSVFSTKSSGTFHLDFKGKGGCCLRPTSAPPGDLAAPQALCTTTDTKLDLLHLLLGLAAMFLLLRLYPRNTTFPDPKGTALESRGLFPPPSLYSILCFFLLPLGAFLLSCMGNADTSWGSPPTGGP